MDEKVISAIQLLNVSEVEAKTYTTLMSLGYADISMLSKVMKVEETEINNVLNTLQQREWILKTNGVYNPINPTQLIKSEIYKFQKNIKKLKSDGLIDLEKLFIQNNLMHMGYKGFMDLI